MVIMGIDPHKRTHAASALQPGTQAVIATLTVEAPLSGYRQLLRWGPARGPRRWAVGNARGLGAHLAQWLVARGEAVEDVPSTAARRPSWLGCCLA
jgi:transposase